MRSLACIVLAVAAAGCGAQSGLHVENGGRTIAVVSPPPRSTATSNEKPQQPSRVTARINLGGSPTIAWDGNATLWAAVWAGGPHLLGSLVPVDTASGKPGAATALPASATPYLVTADTTAVYVAAGADILRIDPATGDVTQKQSAGGRVRALLDSRGSLWAVVERSSVLQLDPATLRVIATKQVTGDPDAITTLPGTVLVTDDESRTLNRMTVRSGKVTKPAGIGATNAGPPSQLTVYDGSIWVYEGTSVLRVAPTRQLKLLDRLSLPGGGGSIAAGAGGVWVSGSFGVARIDPATGDLDTPIDVGNAGTAIATTGSAVWVGLRSGALVRIDTPG